MNQIREKCPAKLLPMLCSAADAALSAGGIVKDLYAGPHQIVMKGDIDLVTEADIASEERILSILQQEFPEHGFMGEESCPDPSRFGPGPTWIIDPLDGTTNFAHGFPYFGISIAYYQRNRCEIGLVNCPLQDELFVALRGGGAYLNGAPIAVSKSDSLIASLVATGFPYNIKERFDEVIRQFSRVLPRVRDIRRAGAAALDLAYVACGRLDGFWEMDLKPWDTAAGALLVTEAGGKVSGFQGSDGWNPFVPEIVASNGRIHEVLVSILS